MSERRINYFFPYAGDVGHFETSLTRAFLALLNLSPLVHAYFASLVREKNPALPSFIELQPQSFRLGLEVSSMISQGGDAVLVHLTGAPSPSPATITVTEEGRRYDAVLNYDCGWTIVIEAKIGIANKKDATANVPQNIHGCVAEISWNNLIEIIWRLIECELLIGTEERLARQFLEYVETNFESLCPYSTLARCSGNATRIRARCTQILRGIGPTDGDRLDLGAGNIARFALLVHDNADQSLALCLYPGDTIGQARKFYEPRHIEDMLNLRERGWSIRPNLHLAFMQRNYVWTQVDAEIEEYLSFWLQRMPQHGQTSAGDESKLGLLTAFNDLVRHRLASECDRPEFIKEFMETARREMNICPGLQVTYQWSLKEADNLDSRGLFAEQVQTRLREALAAWGQTLQKEP
jgi:hypothetical protein